MISWLPSLNIKMNHDQGLLLLKHRRPLRDEQAVRVVITQGLNPWFQRAIVTQYLLSLNFHVPRCPSPSPFPSSFVPFIPLSPASLNSRVPSTLPFLQFPRCLDSLFPLAPSFPSFLHLLNSLVLLFPCSLNFKLPGFLQFFA